MRALHDPRRYRCGLARVRRSHSFAHISAGEKAPLLAQRLAALLGTAPVLEQAPAVVCAAEAQHILVSHSSGRALSELIEQVDEAQAGTASMGTLRASRNSGLRNCLCAFALEFVEAGGRVYFANGYRSSAEPSTAGKRGAPPSAHNSKPRGECTRKESGKRCPTV
jgi:hypothetical protein